VRISTQVGGVGRVVPVVVAGALLAAPATHARLDAPTVSPVATQAPVVVVDPNEGFDWGDAGLGAGSVIAIALFGGSAAALVTRRRRLPAR
jgi:hypothetical protein